MVNITGLGRFLIKWGDPTVESLVQDRIWVAINFFIMFSVLVAVALIVASGYMFMTSSGDPEKVQKAQKALTAAVVGMIIVFLARIIISFVFDVLGGNVASMVIWEGITSFLV